MRLEGTCKHGNLFSVECPFCEEERAGRNTQPLEFEQSDRSDVTDLERCVAVAREAEQCALTGAVPGAQWRQSLALIRSWASYESRNASDLKLGILSEGEALNSPESLRRALWLEGVMWFPNVRPILEHLFIHARPLSQYRLRRIGQDYGAALARHSLDARWLSSQPPADGRYVLLGRFVVEVANELLSNPVDRIVLRYLSCAEDSKVILTEDFAEEAERARKERQEAYDREHLPKPEAKKTCKRR
jgi:hypothetical protein